MKTSHQQIPGIDKIPATVKRLYAIVDELEAAFPGRKFTPDGHLVGSLGEVLAAHAYDLSLLPNSTPVHDAIARDERLVQVKATQTNRIALSSEPKHLLVLRLLRNGSFTEEFNGPGNLVWAAAGKAQKNGQRQVPLSKLKTLMDKVKESEKLPRSGTAAVGNE